MSQDKAVNLVSTDNDLKFIFSAGGYFCLLARTLQVLFCQCVLNVATNLGISSKEERLTGLHQTQKFGQVALDFYLAETD